MLPAPLRDRLSQLARIPRRWLFAGGGALLLLILYPFAGGFIAARLAVGRLEARLGLAVAIAHGRAGLFTFYFRGVTVGVPGRAPLARIERLDVPLSAIWGGGLVTVRRPQLQVERGGPNDNLGPFLGGAKRSSGGKSGGRSLPAVAIEDGTLDLIDHVGGRTLKIGQLKARLASGQRFSVEAHQVSGSVRLRGGDSDPTFGATLVEADGPLEGLRPAPYPRVRISEGYLRVLPTLPLTGINGTIGPDGTRMQISLAGSYGGAKRSLWTAAGAIDPKGPKGPDGALSLRAERFTLDKVADILPQSVLQPSETSVDAALDLTFSRERVGFSGSFDVAGLSLHHEKLASEPIFDLGLAVRLEGGFEPGKRRLELTKLEGRLGHLVGELSGSVELAPGVFKFPDGDQLAALPKIDLRIRVPRIACAKLLQSIPPPIVPKLQGFVLTGTFETDIHTKIDYADLDQIELGGKVGIDGCRVVKAPQEIERLTSGGESIVQVVEVPPRPGDGGPTDTMVFPIGPDNPDFVPYDKISPHIVNALMTTEDGGFFKHRGWVSSEFKTALKRNLTAGAFRFGASSITMQMVKNVLLAHEKTLSRKLQELFIVWYVEQQLPKERILELYLNAIEFGPRLYGIGAAARHYFGKSASDISPLEAAFFSSILPSPKRRYVQYCSGALNAKWDKYVRRILARIHERGRLSKEEYDGIATAPFAFDLTERTMTDKQCLAWVQKITQKVAAEPDPDAETP